MAGGILSHLAMRVIDGMIERGLVAQIPAGHLGKRGEIVTIAAIVTNDDADSSPAPAFSVNGGRYRH